jgi:hypothetical protein
MNYLRHTKLVMIVLSAWTVTFFGALLCITPDKLREGQAFAFLALAPVGELYLAAYLAAKAHVGVLQDFVLVFAQFVCREQETGFVMCECSHPQVSRPA